jgi:hypothetical protein
MADAAALFSRTRGNGVVLASAVQITQFLGAIYRAIADAFVLMTQPVLAHKYAVKMAFAMCPPIVQNWANVSQMLDGVSLLTNHCAKRMRGHLHVTQRTIQHPECTVVRIVEMTSETGGIKLTRR